MAFDVAGTFVVVVLVPPIDFLEVRCVSTIGLGHVQFVASFGLVQVQLVAAGDVGEVLSLGSQRVGKDALDHLLKVDERSSRINRPRLGWSVGGPPSNGPRLSDTVALLGLNRSEEPLS